MAASAALSAVTRIGLHEESFELSDKIISLYKSGSVEDKLCTVTGDDICQMLRSYGYLSAICHIAIKYGCSLAKHFIMKIIASHSAMIEIILAGWVAFI